MALVIASPSVCDSSLASGTGDGRRTIKCTPCRAVSSNQDFPPQGDEPQGCPISLPPTRRRARLPPTRSPKGDFFRVAGLFGGYYLRFGPGPSTPRPPALSPRIRMEAVPCRIPPFTLNTLSMPQHSGVSVWSGGLRGGEDDAKSTSRIPSCSGGV